MGNMDFIRRQNISQINRQFLTSYDWAFYIDFSKYRFYHPTMEMLLCQTRTITGVNPTLDNTPLTTDIRGFKIQQAGMTKNDANASFGLDIADFEDQSIKYWFLDWQNKMDSITTHTSHRRQDLMVDCYVWRLNSNQQKVWEMHYINCLPQTTSYDDLYTSDKQLVGANGTTIQINGEMAIPTPLTQPLALA